MPRDLQVESIPIDRVLPYAANARTHPDEQVTQIAASIAEFGFNVPVQRNKHRRAVSPAVGCRTSRLAEQPRPDGRCDRDALGHGATTDR
jgi:hypothetical protein